MQYPFILVLHEKWGDSFYLMERSQDILDFSIQILKERDKAGWYWKPSEGENTFAKYFFKEYNISYEDATKLIEEHGDTIKIGDSYISATIKTAKRRYNEIIVEFEEWKEIQQTLETDDAKLAWKILNRRSDEGYQYERFTREHIENLKEKG